MYTHVKDFVADWQQESSGTAKLMHALTDPSLSQAVTQNDRTLGRIAWHIVLSLPEMIGRTGLIMKGLSEHAPLPSSAAVLASAYDGAAAELVSLVQSSWTDATLAIEDDMYGMKWARGLTLQVLQRHEIHHRGQMTVLMRQAGIAVPGVYGPSREEWAGLGMPVPEI